MSKKIKIYEFKELSDGAREKALDFVRDGREVDLDYFEEGCLEDINELGFELKTNGLRYSLNNCQGDGLSFLFEPLREDSLNKFLLKHKLKTKYKSLVNKVELYSELGQLSNHYSHYNTVNIDYNSLENLTDKEDILANNLIMDIKQQIYYKICKDLEKKGYDCITDQNSDEAILSEINNGESMFLEDGRIY